MGLKMQLPKWATEDPNNPMRVNVDSTSAYTEVLEELGVKKGDIDQYWLETAFQCIKMDIQMVKGITGLHIHMSNAPEFALKNFKPGMGIHAATKSKHAREYYTRIRGSLPQERQQPTLHRIFSWRPFRKA